MALTHEITIRIRFNEHDNEDFFIRHLFFNLQRLKTTVESDFGAFDKGYRHEDIFFDIQMSSLLPYASEVFKREYHKHYSGFPDWRIKVFE